MIHFKDSLQVPLTFVQQKYNPESFTISFYIKQCRGCGMLLFQCKTLVLGHQKEPCVCNWLVPYEYVINNCVYNSMAFARCLVVSAGTVFGKVVKWWRRGTQRPHFTDRFPHRKECMDNTTLWSTGQCFQILVARLHHQLTVTKAEKERSLYFCMFCPLIGKALLF